MKKEFDLDGFASLLKSRILAGENPTKLRRWVRSELGVGKSRGNEFYATVEATISPQERKSCEPPAVKVEYVGFPDEEGDNVSISSTEVRNLQELCDFADIDLNLWEVTKQRVTRWEGKTSFNAEFKRKTDEINLTQLKNDIKEELKAGSIKVPRIKYSPLVQQNLLEVAVYDFHLGKRTVNRGSFVSSLRESQELFKSTIVELVDRALSFGTFSRILFPIANDFLNVDSNAGLTTGGTPQDTDLSFSEIFKEGRKLLVWAIDYLKQFAPVDVVYVPSNHDNNSMFHMADAIECWYHNDENVTIDNSDKPRKYYLFGQDIVIGLAHGDKAGKKLPALASIECPEWSRRKCRNLHLGHFHRESETISEESGCVIRVIPSLSGTDKWHLSEGWIGSQQRAQAFIWGEDTGLNVVIYSTPV